VHRESHCPQLWLSRARWQGRILQVFIPSVQLILQLLEFCLLDLQLPFKLQLLQQAPQAAPF
jgi:hypothetical protein